MRFLKPLLVLLLAAFAVTAGLVVTVVVALGVAGGLLVRRFLRGSKPAPTVAVTPAQPVRRDANDAIDVVATEVPADSNQR